jgi:hypothetical protein
MIKLHQKDGVDTLEAHCRVGRMLFLGRNITVKLTRMAEAKMMSKGSYKSTLFAGPWGGEDGVDLTEVEIDVLTAARARGLRV